MSLRVIIADDHRIFREGLRTLLQIEPDTEVISEAENGREVIKVVDELEPDLVIMDVAMPDMNGIEATRQITSKNNNIKVLALSMHADSRFVIQMLQAGASGYILKDCAFEELAQAMQSVRKNTIYLSPGVHTTTIRNYMENTSEDVSGVPDILLTPREREILQLIAEGKSTADIAELTDISSKTVDTHRRKIMEKLQLYSVAELTRYAIKQGIVILEE